MSTNSLEERDTIFDADIALSFHEGFEPFFRSYLANQKPNDRLLIQMITSNTEIGEDYPVTLCG